MAPVSTPAADVVGAVTAAAALAAPLIVVVLDAPVLPLVLAAAGLAMSTLRRSGRAGDLAAAGVGVLAVATALALDSSMLGAAAVAAAVTVAAVSARRAGLSSGRGVRRVGSRTRPRPVPAGMPERACSRSASLSR